MPYLSTLLEVWSRQGAIQIHVYLYLYLTIPRGCEILCQTCVHAGDQFICV